MKTSESIGAVMPAFLKAQRKFETPERSGENKHLHATYATISDDLNAVMDALNDAGLVLVQSMDRAEGGIDVETRIIHAESGEWMAGTVIVPVDKNNAHGVGSAFTYGKRYGLTALCALGNADDDSGGGETAIAAPPKNSTGRRTESVRATVQREMGMLEVDERRMDDFASSLKAALDAEDAGGCAELLSELTHDERLAIDQRMNSKERGLLKFYEQKAK